MSVIVPARSPATLTMFPGTSTETARKRALAVYWSSPASSTHAAIAAASTSVAPAAMRARGLAPSVTGGAGDIRVSDNAHGSRTLRLPGHPGGAPDTRIGCLAHLIREIGRAHV